MKSVRYRDYNFKLSYITTIPKYYRQDSIKQDEFKEEINENIKLIYIYSFRCGFLQKT